MTRKGSWIRLAIAPDYDSYLTIKAYFLRCPKCARHGLLPPKLFRIWTALAKGTGSGLKLMSVALSMKFLSVPVVAALAAASLTSFPLPFEAAAQAPDRSEWRAPGPARKADSMKRRGSEREAERQGSSVAATAEAAASSAASIRQIYRIGTGDRLKVTIYNNEKLSGEYPVGGDGKIGLPMLGRVAVGGLTLDEATTLLVSRLADGYFLNPNVTVDMAQYRPVYILGEVQKPGQYTYAEGMTVYRLVAQAGGYSYRANRKKMDLRPDSQPAGAPRQISDDALVQPGDTVIVRQRYF